MDFVFNCDREQINAYAHTHRALWAPAVPFITWKPVYLWLAHSSISWVLFKNTSCAKVTCMFSNIKKLTRYWLILQHEWTLKTLCWQSNTRPHKISRTGKSTESESRWKAAGSWGQKGTRVMAEGYRISFGGWWNFSKIDSGDSCTTLEIY